MSKQIEKNLFIVSSWPAFYQHLLIGIASYQELGSRIIKQIKAAHAFRRVEQVRELARILSNLPIKEYKLIGQYYLAWCNSRESHYDTEALERVIEQSRMYKTKALFSRGAIEWFKGHPEVALCFYSEALKTTRSISEYIDLSRSIAVLKATEGFHNSALKDLENLLPIIRHGEPLAYYEALNSYAVELSEAGRASEARNISQVVINSPFAFAYPEWLETAQELRPANRSFAAIELSKIGRAKLLQMPEIELGEPSQAGRSASVTNIQDWKADMGRKKKSDYDSRTYKDKSFEERDRRELLLTLVEIGTSKKMTDDKLYKVIVYMDKVLNEPDEPKEPEDNPGA